MNKTLRPPRRRDWIKIGNNECLQLKKIQQIEEFMRIGTTNFHDGHVLAAKLRSRYLGLIALFDHDRQHQPFAGAFDQYRFVRKEQIAARQGKILV